MTNNIKTNSSFLRSGSTTRTYSADGVMGESENNVVGILKVEDPVASSPLTLGCAQCASLRSAGLLSVLMGGGF
jgi:hypothetical protein